MQRQKHASPDQKPNPSPPSEIPFPFVCRFIRETRYTNCAQRGAVSPAVGVMSDEVWLRRFTDWSDPNGVVVVQAAIGQRT